jgi:hypothetical protein
MVAIELWPQCDLWIVAVLESGGDVEVSNDQNLWMVLGLVT